MSQNQRVTPTKETTKPNKPQADNAFTHATPALVQRARMAPGALTPNDVKHLQRTIGNRATVSLLSRVTPLQTKLTLGPAGDKYEQEADQVAAQVVRQIDSASVQRQEDEEELQMKPFAPVQRHEEEEALQMKPFTPVQRQEDEEELQMKPFTPVQRQEDEEELQMKPLAANISRLQRTLAEPVHRAFVIQRANIEDEEMLQGKYEHGPEGGEVEPGVTSQIQAARGGGRPLDGGIRNSMENGFGADFSNVRVHTGSQADTLNRSLNARAFTVGSDIFFKRGEYNPGSNGGQKLLAHELTHTVQQGAVQAKRSFEKPVISGIRGSLVALQRAFDASDPATFDNDGGHGYGDHGPQTTETQHKTRLKTGTTPSGRSADIPPSSSKFASLDIMKTAISKAVTDAAKDTVSKGSKRSKKRITLAYNIAQAGISYVLDPKDAEKTVATTVDWVVIILEQTGSGKWDKNYDKIITLFPSATAPAQQDN